MTGWTGKTFNRGTRPQVESKHSADLRVALSAAHPGSFWWKNAGGEFMLKGLPDIFGVVEGHLYAFEVKIDPNWFDDLQVKRLRQLHTAGATTAGLVWNDNDWWFVNVEDLGHKGDRRRSRWLKFSPSKLLDFRSEPFFGEP
jgi:hypothetical protein